MGVLNGGACLTRMNAHCHCSKQWNYIERSKWRGMHGDIPVCPAECVRVLAAGRMSGRCSCPRTATGQTQQQGVTATETVTVTAKLKLTANHR